MGPEEKPSPADPQSEYVARTESRPALPASPSPILFSARSRQRKIEKESPLSKAPSPVADWALDPLMVWLCPWLVDSGDLPPTTQFDLLIRISAQVCNHLGQYERLASILAGLAGADRPQTEPAPSTVATG